MRRQVIQILPNGTVNAFNTITDCADGTGISRSTLSMILNGRRKQLSNGVVYKYGEYIEVEKRQTKPVARTPRKRDYIKRATKCWNCKKSYTNGCSWARSFVPVKEWEAIPTAIGNPPVKSYCVINCPEFVEG